MNNILIVMIFLSPVVNGFEMGQCHAKKATQNTHIICHADKHQTMPTICIDDCCQNCQCDGLMVAVVLFSSATNDSVQIYHDDYQLAYHVFVPFQETHPLLRPPIV